MAVITTLVASGVTRTSFTARGRITQLGDAEVKVWGVEVRNGIGTFVSYTPIGNTIFSKTITGLQEKTTYQYRALITILPGGTLYGSWESVKTLPATPRVTTNPATLVKTDEAKLNGKIDSVMGANCTVRGFKWKKESDEEFTTTQEEGSFTSGSFSKELNYLDERTTYQFRAFATNSEGTTQGTLLSFTTKAAPEVETLTPLLSVTHDTATLEGELIDKGGQPITERGFEWKLGEYGEVNTVKEEDVDYDVGPYALDIEGLTPFTEYMYRAYVVNSYGKGYGEWETFTTAIYKPDMLTEYVSDIDKTTVTVTGNILNTHGDDLIERGFEYGLTQTPTWIVSDTVGGYKKGRYSKGLSDLEPNTVYWVRAYGENTVGISYGDWIMFHTIIPGVEPTNKRITLTGDTSGYVAHLHGDENNDLGNPYEAYFVIATDLTEENSLVYFKRLFDLYNYFRKEESGKVGISIKCDHETDWHDIGEVELTGDKDIIIPHIAPDERGQHFLIKFTAENIFRYLGTIFKFIVRGER